MADLAGPSPRVEVGQRKSAVSSFASRRPLASFFLVTYAWSWTVWLVVPRIVQHSPFSAITDGFGVALIVVGACGPTVGALATRWLAEGDLRICRVWTGWGTLLVGLAVGLAGFFVATVAAPALTLVKVPLSGLNWSALMNWSTYAVNYSTFLGGPVNEEPGWRGFALPRLQDRFGPYGATLILAPIWAAWHLPLFQVQGWSSASPWQFLLILVGASFLLTAAANLSEFNVLVAIVLHACFNTSSGMVNALTHNLPPRPFPMISYTFALFVVGTTLGCVAIRCRSRGLANG